MDEIIFQFIAVAIILGFNALWGVACAAAAKSKGYNTLLGFFIFGFLFSWMALLIVALLLKPEKEGEVIMPEEYQGLSYNGKPPINDMYEDETVSSGGWKCARCGALNSRFTNTCGCGMTRPK